MKTKTIIIIVLIVAVVITIICLKNKNTDKEILPAENTNGVMEQSVQTEWDDPYKVITTDFKKPRLDGNYYYIDEWNLKFPANPENIDVSYSYTRPTNESSSYSADSSIRFQTTKFSTGGGCSLGSISRYPEPPMIMDRPVDWNITRKIDDFYYYFGYEPQEPCWYPAPPTIIAGSDFVLWQKDKAAIRNIFDSLTLIK